jgi:hypothetical protein
MVVGIDLEAQSPNTLQNHALDFPKRQITHLGKWDKTRLVWI